MNKVVLILAFAVLLAGVAFIAIRVSEPTKRLEQQGTAASLPVATSNTGSDRSPVSPPQTPTTEPRKENSWQRVALREAVVSLEGLISAVRSGITYVNYLDRKATARVLVDRYLTDYGQTAPSSDRLREAIRAFDAAGSIWDACIRGPGCRGGQYNAFLEPDGPNYEVNQAFLDFPGLGGAGSLQGGVTRDDALNYLWLQARDATAAARREE